MAEKLTPQQQMAVNNRGGKLLVSAAAGSGKTKVLVERLLSYIEDPLKPANVDDFLIITYTKAAAAELRGKISKRLTEKIAEQPENMHLQRQIQRLYLAKISTVHAFCADILREYASLMDIPADFRVADEMECRELQNRILEQILDQAYETADKNEAFRSFIDTQGFGRDDRMVPDIVLKVYNSARCHLDPEGWLKECVDAFRTEKMTDAGETIWGRYLLEDLQSCLTQQVDAVSRCVERADAEEDMQKPAELLRKTVLQLQALRDCETWDRVHSFGKIDYGRLTFSKKCKNLQLAEQIKAIRNACKKGVEKKMRSFSDSSSQILQDLQQSHLAAAGLAQLTEAFGQQYSKLKLNRRVLDFGDLEHKTLDLLLGKKRTGITSAAREIGRRFREVMVDEYQDSNAVQDAVFSALTQQRQNCFMVGDVKQSIYQFRLADPGIFLEKYNSYTPADKAAPMEGRKVLLSSNFRSSGPVIHAVNDVFSACMSPQVGGLVYGQEEMLYEGIPHLPVPEPEIELHAIEVTEDTYAEEADFVAERILDLTDGSHMIREGDSLRPVTAEDIVILLRSPGSVGGEFQYALERRGIRCSTGDSMDLLSFGEIETLHAFLQVISNPLQDIPLLAVLSSPVFGFTAEELSLLRAENRTSFFYKALQCCHFSKAERFLDILDGLRLDARFCTVSQLLSRIFSKTGFYSIFSAMDDGENRTSNLQTFCQIASDYEASGKKDLEHFLDYLESAADSGLKATTEQSPSGAVTIMSIHKSKGLEFPVVLLCGLSRMFNRESTREQVLCHRDLGMGLSCVDQRLRVRYPSVAKRAIAAKMTAESISEEMRVLYVAMTRARDRLIMTYAAKNLQTSLREDAMRMDLSSRQLLTSDVDCPGSWILQTALARTEAGALFKLAGHPDCVTVSDCPWQISVHNGEVTEVTSCKQASAEQALPRETILQMQQSLRYSYPYLTATRTPSKQTATQLKGRGKDEEAAENTVKPFTREFRRPRFSRQQGKAYGSAMHGVMQFIAFDRCGSISEIRQEVSRLEACGLITQEQGQIVDCRAIAAFFASDLGKKIRTEKHVLREFKFSILSDNPELQQAGCPDQVLLQGVVDCALIEEDGITVLDFKTDYVTEETLQAVTERYRVQVSTYAKALERIYGQPVKCKCLYFFHLNRFAEL